MLPLPWRGGTGCSGWGLWNKALGGRVALGQAWDWIVAGVVILEILEHMKKKKNERKK